MALMRAQKLSPGPSFQVSTCFLFNGVDACTDFECGSQLHVHGGHEVVLFQQQQGLAVNLLGTELLRVHRAALQVTDELIDLLHIPLSGTSVGRGILAVP